MAIVKYKHNCMLVIYVMVNIIHKSILYVGSRKIAKYIFMIIHNIEWYKN